MHWCNAMFCNTEMKHVFLTKTVFPLVFLGGVGGLGCQSCNRGCPLGLILVICCTQISDQHYTNCCLIECYTKKCANMKCLLHWFITLYFLKALKRQIIIILITL